MTEPEIPTTAVDQEKLKKIVAKDSKAGRSMTGCDWKFPAAAPGAAGFARPA